MILSVKETYQNIVYWALSEAVLYDLDIRSAQGEKAVDP